ncbi:hypothetical protein AC1031_010107 [Aphanomyces cochlioides]|nr:hypothetical protein AC1031_010107 [Aphanomyces cochlioides]
MKALPLIAFLVPLVVGAPCTGQSLTTLQNVRAMNLSSECQGFTYCNDVACLFDSFTYFGFGNLCWSSACRRDLDTAAAAFPSCDEAKSPLAVMNGIRAVCASNKFGSTLPLCSEDIDYRLIPLGPKCQALAPSNTTALRDFLKYSIANNSQAYCASTGAAKDCMDELLTSTIPKMPSCQDVVMYWNLGDYLSTFLTGFCAGSPATPSASLTNCVAQLSPFLMYPISTTCSSVFGKYKYRYNFMSDFILDSNPKDFAQICSQTSCIQDINAAIALLPTNACRSIVASDVKAIQAYCAYNMTATATQPNCTSQMTTVEDTIFRSKPDTSCTLASFPLQYVLAPWSVRYFDKYCSQKACVDASISMAAQIPNCQVDGLSRPAVYGGAFSSICKFCWGQNATKLQNALSMKLSPECKAFSSFDDVAGLIRGFNELAWGNICWSSACRRDLDTAAAAFPSCEDAKSPLAVINGIRAVCASNKFGTTLPLCDKKVDNKSIPLGPKCQALAPSSTTKLLDFIRDPVLNNSQTYCASTGAAKGCMDELLLSTIPKMPACQDATTFWNIGDYLSTFLTGFCAGPPATPIASLTNCVAQLEPFLTYPVSTACMSNSRISNLFANKGPKEFAQLCSQSSCIQDIAGAIARLPTGSCASIIASEVKVIQAYCAFNMTATTAQPACSLQMVSLENTVLGSTPDPTCNSSTLQDVIAPTSLRYLNNFCSQKSCADASISMASQIPNCQMDGLSQPALYGGVFSSVCKTLYPPPATPSPTIATPTQTPSPTNATPTQTPSPTNATPTPTPTKSNGNRVHLESLLVGITLVATAIVM